MKYLSVSVLFVIALQGIFAENVQPQKEQFSSGELQARLFIPLGDWQPYSELRYRYSNPAESPNNQYGSFLAGGYWQKIPWLRLGAFYRLETGNQHDDDWHKENDTSMNWEWVSALDRFESSAVADVTLRTATDFFPGAFFKTGLLELKNRAHYNVYQEEVLWQIRPGFTWFWMRGGVPVMNFFVQYETWYVSSSHRNNLWEDWTYFGTLYFVSEQTQIGSTLSWRRTFWEPSEQFRERRPNDTYLIEQGSAVISILFIQSLDF